MKYSETLLIPIQQTCPDNGVYLRWYNPLAGWDGWLFAGDKDEAVNVEEANYYQPAGARVDTVLSKAGKTSLTLRTGNLSIAQAKGISYIHTSPRVQRVYPDGATQEVKVVEGSFQVVNGAEKKQVVTLDIETGTRNTQTN